MLVPVILSGGAGTRLWPVSREGHPKPFMLLPDGHSLLEKAYERAGALARDGEILTVTNRDYYFLSRDEFDKAKLRGSRCKFILEPLGRNTAPAIGLAAFILKQRDPGAIIGMFPSDHIIGNPKRFAKIIGQAAQLAATGNNIVSLGIRPTRPETGYGYIELGGKSTDGVMRVKRFTEKPNLDRAQEFLEAGNYFWNSGIFIWSASTLSDALREHLSETAPFLEQIAAAFGTRNFAGVFRKLYPKCENISVDYAVLEPRSAKGEHASNLFCIPADFGWNDLGSWAALYEYHAERQAQGNVIHGAASFSLEADGNYVHAPKKFVATVGVKNLVVVATDDALLITTRDRAQDVGKIVKHLDDKKLAKLL